MRSIGLVVHRELAQVAIFEGGRVRDEGRIGCTPEELRAWVETLESTDQVALEATGNSDAIAAPESLPEWRRSWSRTQRRHARSPRRRSRPTRSMPASSPSFSR